ncbi:MAG: sarcosine oxidase subunit delta [Gemmobacter sp.]|nr:sarcosine oxidase subunit delta [Gemmobacter sp.]
MRIPCPHCGQRDRREFYYSGADDLLHRPATDDPAAWDNYLHLRDNPAGDTRDLWYHEPCGTWIVVSRNTVTHAVDGAQAVTDVAQGVRT